MREINILKNLISEEDLTLQKTNLIDCERFDHLDTSSEMIISGSIVRYVQKKFNIHLSQSCVMKAFRKILQSGQFHLYYLILISSLKICLMIGKHGVS